MYIYIFIYDSPPCRTPCHPSYCTSDFTRNAIRPHTVKARALNVEVHLETDEVDAGRLYMRHFCYHRHETLLILQATNDIEVQQATDAIGKRPAACRST